MTNTLLAERRFLVLQGTVRLWVVGAIHGDLEKTARLHQALWPRLQPGDRLVYLGNVMGRDPRVAETIDELLSFRRAVMTLEPAEPPQVGFLRGTQEEMWQKLLQLQFATDPRGVLEWMLSQGVDGTLRAYGGNAEEARRAAGAGAVGIARWTQGLRARMHAHPGHVAFMDHLRRAAMTREGTLLCVHAGVDPGRPLETQRDTFWWGSPAFSRMQEPFANYRRVIRGYERSHPGIALEAFTATVDGGCGFGGPLVAACFLPDGELVDQVSA